MPKTPNGTDTRNTRCQLTGPRRPPITSPRNEPAIAATPLIPSAVPRCRGGKASVRIALELAIRQAPPMPWTIRQPMSHSAAASPCIHVTASRTDEIAKIRKPRL